MDKRKAERRVVVIRATNSAGVKIVPLIFDGQMIWTWLLVGVNGEEAAYNYVGI